MTWPPQTEQFYLDRDYPQLVQACEQLLEAEPEVSRHYWTLGLAYLLQEREDVAQLTWATGLMSLSEAETAPAEAELAALLLAEALNQEAAPAYERAWLVRQHLRQLQPQHLDNLIRLVWLSLEFLGNFSLDLLAELELTAVLQSGPAPCQEQDLLLKILRRLVENFDWTPDLRAFVQACAAHAPTPAAYSAALNLAAYQCYCNKRQQEVAIQLLEMALAVDPENRELLPHLANCYQGLGRHPKAIEIIQDYLAASTTLVEQVKAQAALLSVIAKTGGRWETSEQTFATYLAGLQSLTQAHQQGQINPAEVAVRLCRLPYFLPYFRDDLQANRQLQNQTAALAATAFDPAKRHPHIGSQRRGQKVLKLGFVSHCLRLHSVGWLVRWFFKYYNRERFQIYLYFHSFEPDAFSREWFTANSSYAWSSPNSTMLAEKIQENQIDLLIDLDSLTLDTISEIFAWKPAPIQLTWLGWDASGLPTIDYFLADPYVLPENAQDYYQETIWRLPQTYIAVDGFELGVPTRRRDRLGIPGDAVIYLTAQAGFKRNRAMARLQLQIIQQVPNSYLLIKGIGEEETMQQSFLELAAAAGVKPEQLRFLPIDATEYVHRANWNIADVVLDTYPYNGATTTLETLWVGIPLVTRVGQQFAARNSYAFLKNVGVEEGIAWTDQEYVDWGVRFGTDLGLRQRVKLKLRAARQTSPLWNAKQFTQDLEQAFEQMWSRFAG